MTLQHASEPHYHDGHARSEVLQAAGREQTMTFSFPPFLPHSCHVCVCSLAGEGRAAQHGLGVRDRRRLHPFKGYQLLHHLTLTLTLTHSQSYCRHINQQSRLYCRNHSQIASPPPLFVLWCYVRLLLENSKIKFRGLMDLLLFSGVFVT